MSLFNMEGPLPGRIMSLLPALWSADIEVNSLTGTIPPEFHELTEFYASANKFSGPLPAAFFESTYLFALTLSENRELVVNPVPFVGTQWVVLGLDNVSAEFDLLSSVTVLTNLNMLFLSYVGLTGTVPTEIGRLTSLTELVIPGNPSLGGVIPTELQNLVKLRKLVFEHDALAGTLPSALGKLTELRELVLGGNQLSGGMPSELGLLTKLTALLFQGNDFEGTIPPQVCSLKINGNLADFGLTSHIACVDPDGAADLGDSSSLDAYGGLVCPTDLPKCCNC